MMDFKQEFGALIDSAISSSVIELSATLDDVKQYAADRAAFLATIVGEPGFEEAVVSEAQNVAMQIAICAVEGADAVDDRIVGIITGALRIGAAALA